MFLKVKLNRLGTVPYQCRHGPGGPQLMTDLVAFTPRSPISRWHTLSSSISLVGFSYVVLATEINTCYKYLALFFGGETVQGRPFQHHRIGLLCWHTITQKLPGLPETLLWEDKGSQYPVSAAQWCVMGKCLVFRSAMGLIWEVGSHFLLGPYSDHH